VLPKDPFWQGHAHRNSGWIRDLSLNITLSPVLNPSFKKTL